MNSQPCKWIAVDGYCEKSFTDQARCFIINGKKEWIPESQIRDVDFDEHMPECPVSALITEWFIVKKGLEAYIIS